MPAAADSDPEESDKSEDDKADAGAHVPQQKPLVDPEKWKNMTERERRRAEIKARKLGPPVAAPEAGAEGGRKRKGSTSPWREKRRKEQQQREERTEMRKRENDRYREAWQVEGVPDRYQQKRDSGARAGDPWGIQQQSWGAKQKKIVGDRSGNSAAYLEGRLAKDQQKLAKDMPDASGKRGQMRQQFQRREEEIQNDVMSYHTGGGRNAGYRLPPSLHNWKGVEIDNTMSMLPGYGEMCHRCGETGHMSRNCPNVECNSCGMKGHLSRECPDMVCNACGKSGHMARTCPEAKCKGCGELGHTARDCDQLVCHQCGGSGHMVRDCPMGAQHGFMPLPLQQQVLAKKETAPMPMLRVNFMGGR